MPNIVIFTQRRGKETVWVPEADVERWIAFWQRGGSPACRWRDYTAWGGFFPPADSVGDVLLRPRPRSGRTHAQT